MAGIKLTAVTTEIATGTALKTLLRLTAPANQRLVVAQAWVMYKGVDTIGTPILGSIRKTSNDGTSSPVTPKHIGVAGGETIQSVAAQNFTIEPTTPGDIIMPIETHPQSGFFYQARAEEEIIIPGGDSLAMEILAAATTSVVAGFLYWE